MEKDQRLILEWLFSLSWVCFVPIPPHFKPCFVKGVGVFSTVTQASAEVLKATVILTFLNVFYTFQGCVEALSLYLNLSCYRGWVSVFLLSLCSSRLLQVCELVKFMIEHCQQILGEDPTSLFGGPPQRLNTEEMGSGTKEKKRNMTNVYMCKSKHLQVLKLTLDTSPVIVCILFQWTSSLHSFF